MLMTSTNVSIIFSGQVTPKKVALLPSEASMFVFEVETFYSNAKSYLTPKSGCILILRKALNVRKRTGSEALPTMHLFRPSITDRLYGKEASLDPEFKRKSAYRNG